MVQVAKLIHLKRKIDVFQSVAWFPERPAFIKPYPLLEHLPAKHPILRPGQRIGRMNPASSQTEERGCCLVPIGGTRETVGAYAPEPVAVRFHVAEHHEARKRNNLDITVNTEK